MDGGHCWWLKSISRGRVDIDNLVEVRVRTGPNGFTHLGTSAERGTGLPVRFSPWPELWTELGSGSAKFRSEPKFRTELRHPYHRGGRDWREFEGINTGNCCLRTILGHIRI